MYYSGVNLPQLARNCYGSGLATLFLSGVSSRPEHVWSRWNTWLRRCHLSP